MKSAPPPTGRWESDPVTGYDTIRYTVRIAGDGSPEDFEAIHRTVQRTSPNRFDLAMPVTFEPKRIVES